MTVREILSEPNPVLRKKAKKVAKVTSEIRKLIDDMIETMRAAPGVGLAAPQIGVGQRVITVEYAEEPEEPAGKEPAAEEPPPPSPEPVLYVLIDPEITRASREKIIGVEACLSVPGFAGEVERHVEVVVKGYNPQGAPVRIKAKDWLARIFQHEIDHLDGILYVDRAEKVWEIRPEDPKDNV
jgi:peptide deformylase